MVQLCLTQGSGVPKSQLAPKSSLSQWFHAGVDQGHGHPQAKWKQTLNCEISKSEKKSQE